MKMVKTCILLLVFVLVLFLVVQASSINNKTLLSSKFVKNLLYSIKGDNVKKLDQVRKYLSKYGYFGHSKIICYQNNCFTWHDSNDFYQTLKKELKKFQFLFHLNILRILNEKTLSHKVKFQSSHPDLINRTHIKHGAKLVGKSFKSEKSFKSGSHYVIGDTKWPKLNLTWAVEPNIRTDAIDPIISAFESWKNVTQFRFERIYEYTRADVKIVFTHVNEEDGSIFLSNPGAVAYSVLPPPDGIVHFRADIPWVDGAQPEKMDIGTVALHELGHILGLEHSQVPASVMWPVAAWGVTKRNLHEDDIAGIKEMYNFP